MTNHIPVLLKEVLDSLNIFESTTVFDGTLGGGGYSTEILKNLSEDGVLIAVDLNKKAITEFQKVVDEKFSNKKVFLHESNYSNIKNILKERGLKKIDRAVLDLGISSDNLDESKGISFMKKDDPLDMNFGREKKITAQEILLTYSVEDLERIIREYGEEKHSGLLARKIVEDREVNSFAKVSDLTNLVDSVIGKYYFKQKKNPATRIFQALRIEVNDELNNLSLSLENIFNSLESGGILSIVSFHSLEDRIVKLFFKDMEEKELGSRVNKKVIAPTYQEIKKNKRARSAKLRIIKKI